MKRYPSLRSDLLTREVDLEVVVYDPKTGEVYLLNPTAASIAEMCDGKTSLSQISQTIVDLLQVDRTQVEKDVTQIV